MADLHEIRPSDLKPSPRPAESLASGAVGGISLVLVGHPFDLVKVRLQTSTQFRGMHDAFRTLLAREGVAGIYRGVSAPLLGVAPIVAVSIWGYDTGCRVGQAVFPEANQRLAAITLGGALSALPTSLLQVPGDRIKTLMQVSNAPRHVSPLAQVRQVWANGGLRSLYRGYWITLAREIPGSAIYFSNYARGRQWFESFVRDERWQPAGVLLAGGFAGTLNGLLTLPADVIKSRYQAAPEGTFASAREVAVKLWKLEGPKALFRGLGPVLVRAFPANAACFGGIELVRHAFSYFDNRAETLLIKKSRS
jgi:solute carrier family 25 carnitine/acylcarnitine transporter 20/29